MEVFYSNRWLGLMGHHVLLHLALPCYCNCFPQKKVGICFAFLIVKRNFAPENKS